MPRIPHPAAQRAGGGARRTCACPASQNGLLNGSEPCQATPREGSRKVVVSRSRYLPFPGRNMEVAPRVWRLHRSCHVTRAFRLPRNEKPGCPRSFWVVRVRCSDPRRFIGGPPIGWITLPVWGGPPWTICISFAGPHTMIDGGGYSSTCLFSAAVPCGCIASQRVRSTST